DVCGARSLWEGHIRREMPDWFLGAPPLAPGLDQTLHFILCDFKVDPNPCQLSRRLINRNYCSYGRPIGADAPHELLVGIGGHLLFMLPVLSEDQIRTY